MQAAELKQRTGCVPGIAASNMATWVFGGALNEVLASSRC